MDSVPLMQAFSSKMKTMNTMSAHNRANSAALAQAETNECGLCYQIFLPTDDVVYCKKNHLFHVKCFDENVDAMSGNSLATSAIIKCPTCGS